MNGPREAVRSTGEAHELYIRGPHDVRSCAECEPLASSADWFGYDCAPFP